MMLDYEDDKKVRKKVQKIAKELDKEGFTHDQKHFVACHLWAIYNS